jgi:hypothetical protein
MPLCAIGLTASLQAHRRLARRLPALVRTTSAASGPSWQNSKPSACPSPKPTPAGNANHQDHVGAARVTCGQAAHPHAFDQLSPKREDLTRSQPRRHSPLTSKEVPPPPGQVRSWIVKPRAVQRRRQLEWMGKAVKRRGADLADSAPLIRAPAEVADALRGGPLNGPLRSWCRGHVLTLQPPRGEPLARPPRRGSAFRSHRGQQVRVRRPIRPCGFSSA